MAKTSNPNPSVVRFPLSEYKVEKTKSEIIIVPTKDDPVEQAYRYLLSKQRTGAKKAVKKFYSAIDKSASVSINVRANFDFHSEFDLVVNTKGKNELIVECYVDDCYNFGDFDDIVYKSNEFKEFKAGREAAKQEFISAISSLISKKPGSTPDLTENELLQVVGMLISDFVDLSL